MKNISITSDQIKSTETFKGLSNIQKKIHLNSNSRRAIQQSVNVVINQGNEEWFKKTNSSFYHQEIVKELVTLNQK